MKHFYKTKQLVISKNDYIPSNHFLYKIILILIHIKISKNQIITRRSLYYEFFSVNFQTDFGISETLLH